jgi:hypothetical protein
MTYWFGPGLGSAAGQEGGLSVARSMAAEAGATAREARTEIEYLQRDLERLFAVTEALWRILQDEHGYGEAKLQEKIAAVHAARSGEAAGEGQGAPAPCDQCGRAVSRRHPKCVYCGAEHAFDPFVR